MTSLISSLGLVEHYSLVVLISISQIIFDGKLGLDGLWLNNLWPFTLLFNAFSKELGAGPRARFGILIVGEFGMEHYGRLIHWRMVPLSRWTPRLQTEFITRELERLLFIVYFKVVAPVSLHTGSV